MASEGQGLLKDNEYDEDKEYNEFPGTGRTDGCHEDVIEGPSPIT